MEINSQKREKKTAIFHLLRNLFEIITDFPFT